MASRTEAQIIADMRDLAPLPTVYAVNMLAAQGYQLTADVREQLTTRANLFRELFGTTERQSLNLSVRHPQHPAEKIGYLAFSL